MSSFTNRLQVEPLADAKNWKLLRAFSYHVGSRHSRTIIKVPKGFVTDFASIPQSIIAGVGLVALLIGSNYDVLWLIIPGIIAVMASVLLPDWGKYGKAAVIHDYLYKTQQVSRKMADLIFLEAMEVLAVNHIKRIAMYRAVRLFGWLSWSRRSI